MSAQGNVPSLAVERGQRAWKSIKHADKDKRECWLDVGAALAEGRALHQTPYSDQAAALLDGKAVTAHGRPAIPTDLRLLQPALGNSADGYTPTAFKTRGRT